MTKYIQANRQLKLHSPLGEDELLIQSINGAEEFSCLFEYHLELLSPDDQIEGQELVGKQVTIEYTDGAGETRFIDGFVRHLEYVGQTAHREAEDQMSAYSAVIVPWLWFLDNRKDCRIFQDMDTPAIIREVFQTLGFNDFQFSLQANYAPREFCVQYRETDFNFVSRLMEEEGIFYYFKHDLGKHVMYLADAVSGYYGLGDSQVEMVKDQPQFKQLFNWRHAYQFRPGKVAQKDFNFIHPTDDLITDKRGQVKYSGAQKLEIYEYPGRYEDSGAGTRLTQVRMEELETRHDVVEGDSNYLSFAPGGKFTVKDLPRKSEQGKAFVLARVSLQMSNNLDSGGSGVSYHNYFQAIPAGTVFRPERRAAKPVIEGIQTAIITTDGKNEEIVVDEHGRVKVQFHWDRYGKRDFHSSCWIRVSQVHAGKGWGMMDIPRQNEEVIVSFIDGDPDRPLITGRVYNGDNPVPFGLKSSDNAKNKTRRGNMTKTYMGQGYNELSMDDTPGKEQLRVNAQYNMNSNVNNDQTLDVGHDQIETVGNNRTRTVGINESVSIGQNSSETVGKNKNLNVGETYAITTGSHLTETVGGSSSETISKIKSINAGDEIAIVCGAAKLVLKKDGSILLEGKNIVIKGSGKITAKAGGDMVLKASKIGQN